MIAYIQSCLELPVVPDNLVFLLVNITEFYSVLVHSIVHFFIIFIGTILLFLEYLGFFTSSAKLTSLIYIFLQALCRLLQHF